MDLNFISERLGVRYIVVKTSLKTKTPINSGYPAELKTLGDYFRKTRLDLGLSQTDVAKMLNVTTDTITGWELNRHKPTARFAKSIIAFLGYIPFNIRCLSVGKRLYFARLITGMTQKQVANLIGCDVSNLRRIELEQRKPFAKTHERIQDFINTAFSSLDQYWL